jgi:hypothetical protein
MKTIKVTKAPVTPPAETFLTGALVGIGIEFISFSVSPKTGHAQPFTENPEVK